MYILKFTSGAALCIYTALLFLWSYISFNVMCVSYGSLPKAGLGHTMTGWLSLFLSMKIIDDGRAGFPSVRLAFLLLSKRFRFWDQVNLSVVYSRTATYKGWPPSAYDCWE